jgi:hypothetical protein
VPSPDFQELASAAGEWGLLLQLTSNSDAGFLWGDAGHFYFYGHRGAMEKGDFTGSRSTVVPRTRTNCTEMQQTTKAVDGGLVPTL